METNLKMTEATLVVVVTHSQDVVRVFPFWEDTMGLAEVTQFAAQAAYDLCEELGGGQATAAWQRRV